MGLITHFNKHWFLYAVLVLLILAAAASFYRFSVINDYIIYDEFECDPTTDSCFLYCEDEACSEPWYYVKVERYANDLLQLCQGNIIDCEAAYECQPGETRCQVTYCEPTADEDCAPISANSFQSL
jgi:hypothetical protein